jgi:hypothetical protein
VELPSTNSNHRSLYVLNPIFVMPLLHIRPSKPFASTAPSLVVPYTSTQVSIDYLANSISTISSILGPLPGTIVSLIPLVRVDSCLVTSIDSSEAWRAMTPIFAVELRREAGIARAVALLARRRVMRDEARIVKIGD